MPRRFTPFPGLPGAFAAAALALAVSLVGGTAVATPTKAADLLTGSRGLTALTALTGTRQPRRPAAVAAKAQSGQAPVVEAWGDNSAGQLGDATLTPSLVPVVAGTSSGGAATIAAIASGGRHDLALLSNGTVLSWGDDTYGQLGNGRASANDDTETPTLVGSLSDVVAVAAGGEHSLALLSNGTVEAWGDNADGQLGDGTRKDSAIPVPVTGLTGVSAISAGDLFSMALLNNGTVETWGDNSHGELGDSSLKNSDLPVAVPGLSGVSEVSAGGQHALVLLDKGTGMSWGDNETDELGDGQDVSTQALSTAPVAVSGLTGAVAVAAGYQHSLALLGNGTVMAWGDNGFYQLAQPQGYPGGLADSDVPLKVPGISKATAIAAGGLFSLARLSSGHVAGWGDDAFGQLGNSSNDTQQDVVAVKDLTGVTAVAAGGAASLALTSPSAGAVESGARQVSGPPSSPWRVIASPIPGSQITDAGLSAVSAASTTDAWAVGAGSTSSGAPLGETWNGKKWALVTLPAGSGARSSLSGVDDLSATDVWAVGQTGGEDAGGGTGAGTLIEHWDGMTWAVVPSPDPEQGPGTFDELEAVGGTNPDDLWAVGSFSDGENFIALLLLHWNGTVWSFSQPPTEGSVQFGEAVTVISADDVWVVGDTEGGTVSARFDGKSWKMVATPGLQLGSSPENVLSGVTNAGADDVWASGYENDDGINLATPYFLHWTGKAWKLVEAPTSGSEGTRLFGIAGFSATSVWAVGATYEDDGGELALSEKFNGTSWSIVPSLDPGQLASLPDNTLMGIAALGTSTLFTVGSEELPARCCVFPLAERATAA